MNIIKSVLIERLQKKNQAVNIQLKRHANIAV